jgi:hypothetical protein
VGVVAGPASAFLLLRIEEQNLTRVSAAPLGSDALYARRGLAVRSGHKPLWLGQCRSVAAELGTKHRRDQSASRLLLQIFAAFAEFEPNSSGSAL